MEKKIIKRQLTSKGLLLTFEDGTHCLLQAEKLNVLTALGAKAPIEGATVKVEKSVDILGNSSEEWMNLCI